MSLTLAQLLAKGIWRLRSAGVGDAEISSRLILQHLTGKSASGLQLSAGSEAGEELQARFDALIEKRSRLYPLQYLIGEVEFYNVKLKVDERTLIPRPETEALVDNLIPILRSKKAAKMLEIGTGSGNIAIAIAANVKDLQVTAADISEPALELARENARLNRVDDRIRFIHGNCLKEEFWEMAERFDAVVSNPPYVAERDFGSLQPEIRLHEPRQAVLAGNDPLLFFKVISAKAARVLLPGGVICFEIGIGQAASVASIIKERIAGVDLRVAKDLTGTERIIIGTLSS